MSVPKSCTVLVMGGGPAGSYAASALAREGVDVVLLEADVFPRYHIGESMLPSIRHFLRFIDLDSTFDRYGFVQKNGASFKLNSKPESYTDFRAAGGPENHAWNVVRSEADHLMFKHAGQSGAAIFDGTKVESLNFNEEDTGRFSPDHSESVSMGRPISASWVQKSTGAKGVISFEYLVDATGRAGLVSTKYMRNRHYNAGLKNVANWAYWKGAASYGIGTPREGDPYFEALKDGSGWVWLIPLHNGTTSVGVVMNQEMLTARKKASGLSSSEVYREVVKDTTGVWHLLSEAEQVTDTKSASDWSYSASAYARPYVRIAGDAGCFIDPFFSSGVHLALASGLSAALTICAALKNTCTEKEAAQWHSKKVAEGYTRFLLVVMSALKQISDRDRPVLNDWDEESFDRAFAFFRPVIQGTADITSNLTQAEITKTIDFCMQSFQPASREDQDAVMQKIAAHSHTADVNKLTDSLTENERRTLATIQARQLMRSEDTMNIDNFSLDVVDGMVPVLRCGALGLTKIERTAEPAAETGLRAMLGLPEQQSSIFSY